MDYHSQAAAAPARHQGTLQIACRQPTQPWSGEAGDAGPREPRLDELLDDPIMAMLWRGDRLDPRSARATVLALKEVLRRRHRDAEPIAA
jgi:hypothetical protein